MTAKEYLSQIKQIKMRVAAMTEQLNYMKEVAGIASSVLSDLPRNPNRGVHKLEEDVIRQIEWEEKIQSELTRLEEINAIIAAVSDPTMHTLLVKRYVDNDSWEKIAGDLFYSLSQIYRLHGEALAQVKRMRVNES
jgi:hypothetical protein